MNKRVYTVLEFDKILEMLSKKAISDCAKASAKKIEPKTDYDAVLRLMQETKEAERISMGFSRYPIINFSDCKSEFARLKTQAALNCKELLKLCLLFKAAKYAKSNLNHDEEENITVLPELAENLFYDEGFIKKIDQSIMDDETIADTASDQLYSLRKKLKTENEKLREKLSNITKSSDIKKYLQDAIVTSRNGRYVIPVKSEHKKDVKGLIHDQSASGQTLFIEPEVVVQSNNKIKQLEAEISVEQQRILYELSSHAAEFTQDFIVDLEILTYLDLVFAKASLASEMKASPPNFNREKIIHIKAGRHPLVDAKEVVPVTIKIGEDYSVLVITGPNTGGKTVSLKTCGLFQLMAQSGLFLPALSSSSIPVFKKIFADIGDEQSIEQSLSTFSSHMKNIVPILKKSDENTLVLLDELGAGTDPTEGAALALSILESIQKSGGYVMATTHYSEIKAFAMVEKGYENASMEFDIKTLSPTYNLRMGIPGLSNAFEISKKLGMPEYVILDARKHMSEEHARFEQLLNEAAASKQEADMKIVQAESFKRKSQSMKDKAIIVQEKADKREKEIISKAKQKALDIVNDAKYEAERIITDLKKVKVDSERERTQAIADARRGLQQNYDALNSDLKSLSKTENNGSNLPINVGDTVKLIGVGTEATVLEKPDAKGMVKVQAGIMKLSLNVSEIENVSKPKKVVNTVTARAFQKSSKGKIELDIRGLSIDEGMMEVDRYLDDVFLSGLNEVSIIHGKGTGKLRQGIHSFLKAHARVKSFRLGLYGEGEAGVTVVTMK
jgi:DNA mismatch repair protein MutS2